MFTESGKKGLGGHLFEALHRNIPVIGVAKTFYKGCRSYSAVFRGKSRKPLFVSSIGVALQSAAALIENLEGGGRLPCILKEVDRLTRLAGVPGTPG